jgi:hypothetical protein
VRAAIVELDELSRAEIAIWRALAEQAAEPNPFSESDRA